MTTDIDTLLYSEYVSDDEDDEDDEDDNLLDIVMDLSRPVDVRLNALEEYYAREDIGDNAIEVFSTLTGMYHMSSSKLIEQFLLPYLHSWTGLCLFEARGR